MNVVDSSGWLEYFGKGKNADFFAPAVEKVDRLIVPTICIYEVFKQMMVLREKDSALRAVGIMSLGQVIELNTQLALMLPKSPSIQN